MAQVNLAPNQNASPHSNILPKTSSHGLKQSMVLTKTNNPALSFTNRSTHTFASKKNLMSQSCIRKEPSDLDSFMKEVNNKFNSVYKTLHQHGKQLHDIRQKQNNNLFSNINDSFSRNQSFSGDFLRSVRKQFQQDSFKLRNNIYAQIDSVKAELRNQCIRKSELEFMFHKFESNITNSMYNTKQSKQISNLKNKLKYDLQNIESMLNQNINAKFQQIFNISSKHFLELTNHIDHIKFTIENIKEQIKPSFFCSNQKCYSPKMIKYKQVMQKLSSNTYDKPGEQQIIGQMVYYVDSQGYLLDANFYYLVDKDNKQVKLDEQHISLLNIFNLLK